MVWSCNAPRRRTRCWNPRGDIIVNKYRVARILGIGGMGVVVAAHHLRLDELVARLEAGSRPAQAAQAA